MAMDNPHMNGGLYRNITSLNSVLSSMPCLITGGYTITITIDITVAIHITVTISITIIITITIPCYTVPYYTILITIVLLSLQSCTIFYYTNYNSTTITILPCSFF